MRLNIIYVYYNKECDIDMRQFDALSSPYTVYVVDNSTKDEIVNNNAVFCVANGLMHINNGGNKGLSAAYNSVIKNIPSEEYILLFDDDTKISREFYAELSQSIVENKYRVIVPKVLADGVPMSPSHMKKFDVKPYDGTFVTAINSGMTIQKSVFDEVGLYDERFFLDYVDHNFCRKVNENGIPILIIDAVLEQRFSGRDYTNYNASLARFKIFKKDFKIFCFISFTGRIYYYYRIWKRVLKLTIKFRKFEFIKIMFRGA